MKNVKPVWPIDWWHVQKLFSLTSSALHCLFHLTCKVMTRLASLVEPLINSDVRPTPWYLRIRSSPRGSPFASSSTFWASYQDDIVLWGGHATRYSLLFDLCSARQVPCTDLALCILYSTRRTPCLLYFVRRILRDPPCSVEISICPRDAVPRGTTFPVKHWFHPSPFSHLSCDLTFCPHLLAWTSHSCLVMVSYHFSTLWHTRLIVLRGG